MGIFSFSGLIQESLPRRGLLNLSSKYIMYHTILVYLYLYILMRRIDHRYLNVLWEVNNNINELQIKCCMASTISVVYNYLTKGRGFNLFFKVPKECHKILVM